MAVSEADRAVLSTPLLWAKKRAKCVAAKRTPMQDKRCLLSPIAALLVLIAALLSVRIARPRLALQVAFEK